MTARTATLLAGALLACAAEAQTPTGELGLAPYRATYTVFEGDDRVGESVFTLELDPATRHYRFESRTRFRGWLRLAAPRDVVEHSEFVVASGAIRPITFEYQDGTWRGRRNLSLRFNWNADTLTIEDRDGTETAAIEPGTLDRGSVRVALMRDLAGGRRAGSHMLAYPDVVRAYAYAVEAEETVATPLGDLATQRIRQQREGSSRYTLLWAAPSLDYVTVRMERRREDRPAIAFVIESIEWLGSGARASLRATVAARRTAR